MGFLQIPAERDAYPKLLHIIGFAHVHTFTRSHSCRAEYRRDRLSDAPASILRYRRVNV
jgi:hypothetical protein